MVYEDANFATGLVRFVSVSVPHTVLVRLFAAAAVSVPVDVAVRDVVVGTVVAAVVMAAIAMRARGGALRSCAGPTAVVAHSAMMYVKVDASVSVTVEAVGQEEAMSVVLVYTAAEDVYSQQCTICNVYGLGIIGAVLY